MTTSFVRAKPERRGAGAAPELRPRATETAADSTEVDASFDRNGRAGSRAWRAVLAVGLCAIGGYFLLPGTAAKDFAYSGIGIASVLIIAVATKVRRPANRLGWYLLAASGACFVLGDGVYDVYDLVLHRAVPFPSIADALYLLGYPFLFVGVARVSRLRRAPGSREARADAAMVSVAALALSWQFLMGSYAHDETLSQFGKLVTLAYPIMDIGVLFIVVSAIMTRSARRPADKFVAAAVFAMLVADFAYDVIVLHSQYSNGNPVDALFLLNYVLMATAVMHPSAVLRPPPVVAAPTRRRWLWLVAAAAFVSPSIIVISDIAGVRIDAGVLAGTTIALCALAVVRASWLFARLRLQATLLEHRGESLQTALEAQHALESDLRHQAFHDSLTGLANRALLHDRVEHALEASARRSGTVAVCFCDLDGFKGVNDSLGHGAGDELLIIAAKRLKSVVRSGDTVARLGGDEFAVLIENVDDPDIVTALADRIVSVLRQPVVVGEQELSLSVSVGLAFAGADATTALLLSEADAAMYDAKSSGKDRYAVFETFMRSRIIERMEMMNSFQGSLHRGEYFLEYQPQLRLSDGSLEGFEALVRWQHPTLGLISPYQFIPLAEETGFIVPLGRWVLERACVEAASWAPDAGAPMSVSVNLSGRQLQDANLAQDVRTALSFSGLPPEQLVLEITENVLMADPATIATLLEELKAMGVRIAIDDFGTGYSSLSYLRRFPVDILKIDKCFIDPLADPANEGDALVHTILQLAEQLHLAVTAEGIEHQTQRDALTRLRCHSAQGYLMSRPLSAAATHEYVTAAAQGRLATPAGSAS